MREQKVSLAKNMLTSIDIAKDIMSHINSGEKTELTRNWEIIPNHVWCDEQGYVLHLMPPQQTILGILCVGGQVLVKLVIFGVLVYLWLYNAPSRVSSLGSSLVRLLYPAEDGKSTLSLISSSAGE